MDIKPPDNLKDYKKWLDEAALARPTHLENFQYRKYMNQFRPPGKKIVDMGGYLGATAVKFAKRGYEVTSIEGSDVYADRFEENTKGIDGIRLVRSLIEDFDEIGYDGASCTEILNHVCSPYEVLKVGHNCLRDGGMMFAVTHNRPMPVERQTIGLEMLTQLMKDVGFRVKTSCDFDGLNMVWGYK